MVGDMQPLSKHLRYGEIKCRCGKCGGGMVHPAVVKLFEEIREKAGGYKIFVTSGYRCMKHNRDVGGAENSEHLYGRALDLKCPIQVNFERFAEICNELNPNGGVGIYRDGGFVHVDVRGERARWYG